MEACLCVLIITIATIYLVLDLKIEREKRNLSERIDSIVEYILKKEGKNI